MNVKVKDFVADASQIKTLTTSLLSATAAIYTSRTTYLRFLAGTTIAELGAKPRVHQGRPPKVTPETLALQLVALEAVHERFYAAVTEAASINLPGPTLRAKELNRRTNFARTAVGSLRRWMKAGNDITTLVVGKVTKRSLVVERAVRPQTAGRLKTRAENNSKALMATVLELSGVDKAAALEEIELLIGQLATQRIELGGMTTVRPQKGMHEGLPFKAGGHTFYPVTETQVIRQQRAPS